MPVQYIVGFTHSGIVHTNDKLFPDPDDPSWEPGKIRGEFCLLRTPDLDYVRPHFVLVDPGFESGGVPVFREREVDAQLLAVAMAQLDAKAAQSREVAVAEIARLRAEAELDRVVPPDSKIQAVRDAHARDLANIDEWRRRARAAKTYYDLPRACRYDAG